MLFLQQNWLSPLWEQQNYPMEEAIPAHGESAGQHRHLAGIRESSATTPASGHPRQGHQLGPRGRDTGASLCPRPLRPRPGQPAAPSGLPAPTLRLQGWSCVCHSLTYSPSDSSFWQSIERFLLNKGEEFRQEIHCTHTQRFFSN